MHEPYDLFAPHWSAALSGDGSARMLNNAVKHVVTSRIDPLDWVNSHRISGDVGGAIARLKSEDGPLLEVYGSLFRHCPRTI